MKHLLLTFLLLLPSLSFAGRPVLPLHPIVSHADAQAWCIALYANAGMNVPDSMIRDCTKIVMHNGYVVVIIVIN